MPIAYIDSQGANDPTTGGTATTAAMDTTGADCFVAVVANNGSDVTLGAVTDSQSNTWTKLSSAVSGSSEYQQYYCLSPATNASHTFTFTNSGERVTIVVAAYSGVASYETETTNTISSSNPFTPGSITPGSDGALVAAGCCSGVRNFSSVSSPHALVYEEQRNSFARNLTLVDDIQSTAAASNPSMTFASTADMSGGQMSFLASGGGGGGDVLARGLSAIEQGVIASRGMHTIEEGFIA